MGVEIKLTDRQFPVSPLFIEFLQQRIDGDAIDATWHDQLSETLVNSEGERRREVAQAVAERILDHPAGRDAIVRAYDLFTAILAGQPEKLRWFHERYRFLCIVGCPRHGGSYLTKQLFRAIGMNPDEVPNVVAHDGFPDAGPFELVDGHNTLTGMMQQTAEYLAMIEVFFADSRLFGNRVVVPKKATKAAYHGGFFHRIHGPDTEYLITLRHPVAACISTYEKSTGLPADGRFAVRGNIEEWARRDNLATGEAADDIVRREYFDVYLRYWEQYHLQLVLTGLPAGAAWQVVAYGRERMEAVAAAWFARFRSRERPEPFAVFDKRDRHPDWMRKGEQAVLRVAGMWRTVGRVYPVDEILECW